MGGRFGGYGLYLLKGKPVFVYNLLNLKRYRWEGGVGGADWLGDFAQARQAHDRVRFQSRTDPASARAAPACSRSMARSCPARRSSTRFRFSWRSTRASTSGAIRARRSDDSYKLPFRFNGTINKLTYKLGQEQLTAEERAVMQKALGRRARLEGTSAVGSGGAASRGATTRMRHRR